MKLPSNLWKSPVIKKRLFIEASFDSNYGVPDKKHYWIIAPEADSKNGKVVLKNFEPDELLNIPPHPMQEHFAEELQGYLTKELNFNGLWLVGWTHPPQIQALLGDQDNCWSRLVMIWHDEDGDPQYTVESELPFANMIALGFQYYAGLANQAHEQWNEMYSGKVLKSDMNLSDNQQTTVALNALKGV